MTDEFNQRCILCNSPVTTLSEEFFDTRFGLDRMFSIGRCDACGMEQIDPMPKQDEIGRLYERLYNFGGERNTAYTRLRERFLLSPFYRFWLLLDGDISFHNRKGSGKLLDIGCNEGRGLRLYRQNGYAAEGQEINVAAAAVARSYGFTVHVAPLGNFPTPNNYDVAVLSNVLEHTLDPQDMLSHVRRMLVPGGGVWISCPNSRSWLRSVFGRHWINWHVPFHIAHFSVASLRNLLEKSGFEITGIRQETPALWVAHSIVARLFAKRGRPTGELRNPFLIVLLMLLARGVFFPFLWLGNRLGRGDCLVLTAQKR